MKDMYNFLKQIKSIGEETGEDIYIVGGFIRDKLFNSQIDVHDLNLVCSGSMQKVIEELSKLGYYFKVLDNGKYKYKNDNMTVDIALINGSDIVEDLNNRDYTANAIALRLTEIKIIDPFDGRKAIRSRIIKQVNKGSLSDDPIRILRGIRMYIKYGMHFNFETEEEIRRIASRLYYFNGPNKFYEFMKVIEADFQGKAFEILYDYGVLSNIFPYIEELKTVGKCKYHIEDALTHMNLTYQVFKDLVNGRIKLGGIDIGKIDEVIDEFNIKNYIALSCFLHDIGKFKCYKKQGDRVSFYGHEIEGAKIVHNICNNMQFSKDATEIEETIVEAHMMPLEILKMETAEQNEALNSMFSRYRNYIPYIFIVSFCDNYATNMLLNNSNEKIKFKQFIENALLKYRKYRFV
ncbi:CCA tRNA nucleotidyltransferase [Clostridium fermenticellae]|uniref:CCA tRNA nucleotidyltransferase n=1 Tax=Clostridium fermenticellae TaxID=2068654 RepID=A0A386H0B3_9CLOT|nr:HD domain-containing protein [Clostridium fermenticellae]AYD39117.1 CCA tRNA nucleotidyltransferase [Clostridium fermenticellae]